MSGLYRRAPLGSRYVHPPVMGAGERRRRQRMINVRHLAVFRAVMKTGSVSAAARVLNVSQPAITKTLQLVESRIGVPLFRRLKGRLHATAESMLLMPGVDQIFGAVE